MSEPGGGFLREERPGADRWYSRDVQAIAARAAWTVAPYFVDQDAGAGRSPALAVGGLTVISFNNNHLVYALTWFALAAMARRRLRGIRPRRAANRRTNLSGEAQ
jgi:surfeit locus 1 family protein